MTPRFDWTPASEPPDTARNVLIWFKYQVYDSWLWAIGHYDRGHWSHSYVTHWRDVEPPKLP